MLNFCGVCFCVIYCLVSVVRFLFVWFTCADRWCLQARAKVNEDDKKPIWFPVVGGGLTKEDMLCVDIRRLQQRSGCSDVTCKEVLQMFKQYLGDLPTGFRSVDKKCRRRQALVFCVFTAACSVTSTSITLTTRPICVPMLKSTGRCVGILAMTKMASQMR